MTTKLLAAIKAELEKRTGRGAWNKGVTEYAAELLDHIEELIDGGYYSEDDLSASKILDKMMLNGADDWEQFSWGGCSLIYDSSIAERLCNPSELKRTHNGRRRPNSREEWLDTQARALYQAAYRLKASIKAALEA